MPPATGNKQKVERAAWQWAESCDPDHVTKEHVRAAYRLNAPACKNGGCRRNCRANPLCLNALGESKWLGTIDDKYWYEVEDPEDERRPKDTFAGLKNLGATCYVNTFLQLWFHNTSFRQAIYKYEEYPIQDGFPSPAEITASVPSISETKETPCTTVTSADATDTTKVENSEQISEPSKLNGSPVNGEKASKKVSDLPPPKTIGGHLQQVFALLQFSCRRYIDPTPFINSLGLDAALQQDAQEFSKLFLSLLEDNLSTQVDPSVHNLVQEQCLGQYQYVTKCSQCKSESKRSAEFYELDLPIRGHKTLNASIDEFLQEEKLEGDNQYMCGSCNSKQNAVRYIQLERLPPVLNLQLLRFVFDRTTGHKKKLNSFLEFPETLDLGKYLHTAGGEELHYDLCAVLIHRGPSAYSGHYIAHIQAEQPGGEDTWYKFNDEEIEKMGGRNLQLGREEDIEGKGGKKPRTAKGHHASRNAYMLVYVRRKDNTDTPVEKVTNLEELSPKLRQFVAHDNARLEEWIQDMSSSRDSSVQKGKDRQTEIQQLFNMSFVNFKQNNTEFDLVPMSWWSKWLASDYADKVPDICNTELLCAHGKVNPDKAGQAKCISSAAADLLYAKYGTDKSERLKGESSLCEECVVERCRIVRTKARMEEDNRVITAALKEKENIDSMADCYWVGKASLRSWKRLAMEKLREQEKESANANGNNHQQQVAESPVKEEKKDETKAEGIETIERISFNEDLLCIDHDELALDESCRRLVSGDVWRRLKSYFSAAPEYPENAEICRKCSEAVHAEQMARDEMKQVAKDHKSTLANLYLDKNRAHWSNTTQKLYIVPAMFLEEWRKFIREPCRRDPISSINNSMFLCEVHQGFLYNPESIGVHPSTIDRLSFIYPEEWQVLSKSFSVDTAIEVTRTKAPDGTYSFAVTPSVCAGCCEERQQAEHELRMHYKNATIYILKVTNQNQILAGVGDAIGSSCTPEPQDNGPSAKEEEVEFVAFESGTKRKRYLSDVSGGVEASADTPAEKVARLDVRRSTRHRRLRGEKTLSVDATNTLKDLKVMIMKLFSVAPFDQNLWLNGSLLNKDGSSTLASLGVLPGDTIYLKEDEPTEDPGYIEDISSASHIEEGFKGTGLTGRR